MIHKLFIFNFISNKGAQLFESNKIKIKSKLLLNLIRATTLLGEEIEETHSSFLQEMEIGEYQIALFKEGQLVYVIVQDYLDNEPFTKKILQHVVTKYHEDFISLTLTEELHLMDDYRTKLKVFFDTMKFPEKLLVRVEEFVTEFMIATHQSCDIMILTDLDGGPVCEWKYDSSEGIQKVLLEILSELDIEKSWIGEVPILDKKTWKQLHTEIWFIFRLGITDFCLLGRAKYILNHEREHLLKKLEELSNVIHSLLFQVYNY